MLGSTDQIAAFLSATVPFAPGTYVNIHAFGIDPAGKLIPKGSRAARDLQEAASFARWADSQGLEVYVCMSSQRQPGTGKVDKRGRTHYRALRGELNASATRSFYLDVDVKPGAYATTQEAIDAVQAFCAAVGLPLPSLVVYSGGGGFHAHWVLNQPITPAEWKPIAGRLDAAVRQHGLKADPGVTVDVARILRVPGTTNRKYGAPRPTSMQVIGTEILLEQIQGPLAAYTPIISGGAPRSAQLNDSFDPTGISALAGHPLLAQSFANFSAGITTPDPTLDEVALGCPFVAEAIKTGGAGYLEPLWFLCGQVALHTSDGAAGFHRMSSSDPRYSPAGTDTKYEQIKVQQAEKDLGWPRCETIESRGGQECLRCPHRGAGKSPLHFAVRATPTPPPVTPPGNPAGPPPPGAAAPPQPTMIAVDGYFVNSRGNYAREHEEHPDGIEVLGYPMWNLDYKKNPGETEWGIHFDTQIDGTTFKHIVVPNHALVDSRSLRDTLVNRQGVGLKTYQSTELMNFMASFQEQLKRQGKTITVQETLGWSLGPDGKAAGFVYGSTRFNCSGNVQFFQTDPMIKKTYTPTGDPQAWRDAIAMANAEQRPSIDVLIATAFGAPLMRFTGNSGVVISGYSPGSALHKTTALRIGQAVWGGPEGINQLTDTMNSVIEKMGKTKVLPVYYDEMKASADVQKFSHMVYTLSGGRGKGRLGRNAEIRDVGTWDTLLVGASNDSLISHLIEADRTTEAGVNRVFEFEVEPVNPLVGQLPMGTAGAILEKLKSNYGHAGLAYAELLGKNVDTLPQRVTDTINDLEKRFASKGDERFWMAGMAVTLLGAQMANSINLTRFDVGRMIDFMGRTLARLREVRGHSDLDISKTDNIIGTLSQYINSNRRAVIVTDTWNVPRGRRPAGTLPVKVLNYDEVRNAQQIGIHISEGENAVRISLRHFLDWCQQRKLPGPAVVSNIERALQPALDRHRIGVGTDMSTSKERTMEFSFTNPDIAQLFED